MMEGLVRVKGTLDTPLSPLISLSASLPVNTNKPSVKESFPGEDGRKGIVIKCRIFHQLLCHKYTAYGNQSPLVAGISIRKPLVLVESYGKIPTSRLGINLIITQCTLYNVQSKLSKFRQRN